MRTEEESFFQKVKVRDSGCWEWTANTSDTGYGVFAVSGRGVAAHRWSYQFFIGELKPNPFNIDHLCRNRKCCNPTHLEQVTMKENILRGVSPSAKNKRKTYCSNGHPLTGENLYVHRGHRRCQTCTKAYQAKYRLKNKGRGVPKK